MLVRKGQHSAAGAGFTQVELLVVIGLIALLAAVLLPSVDNGRRSGKAAAGQRHAADPRPAPVRTQNGSALDEADPGQSTAAQTPPEQGSGLNSTSPSWGLTPEITKKRVGPPTADDQAASSAPIVIAAGCTGDTCATAITVPSLPFSTSGNTCSCVSNYDVETTECTPDVISGPDVVFRYAPTAAGCIDISLCGGGTTFDSKILLYQNSCDNPIDCNDDSCDLQSELRNVSVAAGSTYYIVVDGYEGDCGDYHLAISRCAVCGNGIVELGEECDPPNGVTCDSTCHLICNITCDRCANPENEPNCGLPVDTVNGGCNNPTRPAFTPLTCGDTFCGTGAFNGNTRDTDWYKLVLGVPTTVTWTVAAEFRALVGIIETGGVNTCPPTPNFRVFSFLAPCTTGSVSSFLPAGTWYLIVAPDFAGLVPCGAEYNAALTCSPSATEACCKPDGTCQVLPHGQCCTANGTAVSHCPSDGRCVPPGNDCFNTPCGRTEFDFCNDPIPAGFFGPGSEPFTGIVRLGGTNDGVPDTTVARRNVMLLDGPPETVPIELVQLSLTSCSPITVVEGGVDTFWDVHVGLSPFPVPQGSMTVAKQHPNGGVFSATFNVLPRFTFTQVGNPSNVRVLDTGAEGIPPEPLMIVGGEPWVYQKSPQIPYTPCGVNFVPGVEQNPQTLEQCCTETCHDNPGGGHKHCTKQCNVCPRGACCNPQNGTCSVVQGATACPGQYKGDGTNCADSDGDGIPDWFENNDCCRPSTPCNIASNPFDPDTDNDGVNDGAEIAQLCDPCTAGDCIPIPCCLPSGSCRSLSSGLCAAGGGKVVSHCPSDGRCVPPGDDCFNTQCGRTLFDFCNDPIPADFFAPSSEPFTGLVRLGGSNDGLPDTVVRRYNAMLLDGPPETVPIELVSLSLVSCQPISVVIGTQTTHWNVSVRRSQHEIVAPIPLLHVTKTHANGGTFSAEFYVQPLFTFTQVENPSNVRVLDTGAAGMPPTLLQTVGSEPWVFQMSPQIPHTPCGVNFVPGVEENPQTHDQCCTETCHANPSGGHDHCTKQCNVCPRGACCNPQNGTCSVVQGAAACPGEYKGDGTNCADSDGDGIPDWFENNDCCRPSTTCNIASNPNDPDTDKDGVPDGVEVAQGCDPCVPGCGASVCEPNATQTACKPTTCENPAEECRARCGKLNPFTGAVTVNSCDCRPLDECHLTKQPIPGVTAGGGGNPCVVVDNGGGSVDLPPAGCAYLSPDEVHKIIDGLPAGTEIHLAPIHKDFICHEPGTTNPVCSFSTLVDCKEAGGSLGGEKECAVSNLQLDLSVLNPPCPGPLCGWNRQILVPMAFETHTAPRTPGSPVQSFDTDMFRMFGQINQIGDPDFDLLRIVGGTDFGMPSPGHTTLTKLPGGNNWAVDSFFDITYRIDFVGAPGGRLAGRSGSTTATIRMQTGAPFRCEGGCPAGFVCEENRVVNADGTIDLCCDCQAPTVCEPNAAGTACNPVTCPDSGTGVIDKCQKKCVIVNPLTGTVTLSDCDCSGPNECHMELATAAGAANTAGAGGGPTGDCVVVDDGSGTVKLPPDGCPYLSPDEFHKIVDGLPTGVTIEIGAIHKDFICRTQPGAPSICSFTPPPGTCDDEEPNNVTDGEKECNGSTLELNMRGTGMGNTAGPGWSGIKMLPVQFETHTGPRTPGMPIQSFDTDMFRLQGQLPIGDPDFDLLRITAGTGFGMPSPGHTTLTRLPSNNWAVDSFFDIEYRIDFIGAPGGPLAGMSGSTTGTIRMATKQFKCVGDCPPGTVCTEQRTPQADGTVKVCCACEPIPPPVCETDPTTGACRPNTCPAPEECIANCAKVTQVGGATTVTATDCHCDDPNTCHLKVGASGAVTAGPGGPCEVVDNGSGSVDLPPAGCDYLSPDQVHKIIDGLPAGTEIHLAPIHKDFICHEGQPGGVCSFPPGVDCREDGGDLGGEKECSNSTLEFQLTGTGTLLGWNRIVTIPNTSFETHTGVKKPGQPVQSFPTEMFRMFGQISGIGDPDFDLLRIVAGTDFGMPSPGHTTLTRLPNNHWAVDSFFDITYRIDFVGSNAPGSRLGGRSGSTTATIRMATNAPFKCTNTCPTGQVCVQTTSQPVPPDGTMTVCCDCVPTEACCLPSGACTQLAPSSCRALNGTPQGPGSTCSGRNCPGAGDCNHDGHSDLRDIAAFQIYFTGPGGPIGTGLCADLDADGDIDLDDWKVFKRAITGP